LQKFQKNFNQVKKEETLIKKLMKMILNLGPLMARIKVTLNL